MIVYNKNGNVGVDVGPGNVNCMSIRQVSLRAAMYCGPPLLLRLLLLQRCCCYKAIY